MTLRSATLSEQIRRSGEQSDLAPQEGSPIDSQSFLDRTGLALGHEMLRSIVGSASIMVVGMGGLGSVIAEHLVHLGFDRLILVDNDVVETSNLNRIVGAYWEDAVESRLKVDVVSRHLKSIRPNIEVRREPRRIEEIQVDPEIASLDWIILATDSHSSRFATQELAFKFFIPFVSAGVSITVTDGMISDYSGEVIVVRPGDRLCLTCLNRLNPTKIAFERALAAAEREPREEMPPSPDEIGEGAILKPDLSRLAGYVSGATVTEPAVKTLNSVVGSLAVEQLLNQYTHRTAQHPILVYERNADSAIYPDVESVVHRNMHCITCGIIGTV